MADFEVFIHPYDDRLAAAATGGVGGLQNDRIQAVDQQSGVELGDGGLKNSRLN